MRRHGCYAAVEEMLCLCPVGRGGDVGNEGVDRKLWVRYWSASQFRHVRIAKYGKESRRCVIAGIAQRAAVRVRLGLGAVGLFARLGNISLDFNRLPGSGAIAAAVDRCQSRLQGQDQ